jgi:hypothetical protein
MNERNGFSLDLPCRRQPQTGADAAALVVGAAFLIDRGKIRAALQLMPEPGAGARGCRCLEAPGAPGPITLRRRRRRSGSAGDDDRRHPFHAAAVTPAALAAHRSSFAAVYRSMALLMLLIGPGCFSLDARPSAAALIPNGNPCNPWFASLR